MKPDWSCVLFDLDGTIADSAPGITATLAHMFEELGMPVPSPAELLSYVGPPILDAFRDFAGFSPERSARALAIYRKEYALNGVNGTAVYQGMPELLRELHTAGMPISLATSKPERPARQMLDHYGLSEFFTVLTGASADETRSAKADVVAEAIRRLAAVGTDVSRPVMVGDRMHDIAGAAEHGIPTVFVRWGYGSEAEESGSIAAVSGVEELRTLLLPRSAGESLDDAAVHSGQGAGQGDDRPPQR